MKKKSFALYGHIAHAPKIGELKIYENSYIVCERGRVAGVFSELPERFAGLPVERHDDCLIFPGLVDLHIHAPQYAFRGTGMDWELIDWLNNQTFPEEAKYADLDYAARAYGIFAECMKNSATTRASIFATRHRWASELLMDLMFCTSVIT